MLLALAAGLVAAVFLTDSRNAWGALVLAVPLVLGPASWLWLLPLLFGLLLLVTLASLPGVPPLLQDPLRQLVPEAIWGGSAISTTVLIGYRPRPAWPSGRWPWR